MSDQASAKGRFVWRDLMTSDVATAADFYKQLLDWEIKEVDMPTGPYTMISVHGNDIGGIVPLDDGGPPPHWISYVTVDDVDATCKKAAQLGGEVHVEPTDLPGVGRFAVLADPQGAFFSPFSFAQESAEPTEEARRGHRHGQVAFYEMLSKDNGAAAQFYADLLGWQAEPLDMGDMGTYHLARRGEKDEAGFMQMPPQAEAPPHWLMYIAVDDVDGSAAKAGELGGKALCPPTDIPGVGRFSVIQDPTGASFAIFKPGPAAPGG